MLVVKEEFMKTEEPEAVLVGEDYSSGLLPYLLSLESAASFLPAAMLPESRGIVVTWLSEVNSEFGLSDDILHLGVKLMDLYMASSEGTSTDTSQLQLVGVTALLLAAKVEGVRPVRLVNACCTATNNTYSAGEVMAMERKMCVALDWRLMPPRATNFLSCYCKVLATDNDTVAKAIHLMKLCLPDDAMKGVKPSRLAAATLFLAMRSGGSGQDLSLLEELCRAREGELQLLVERVEAKSKEEPRPEPKNSKMAAPKASLPAPHSQKMKGKTRGKKPSTFTELLLKIDLERRGNKIISAGRARADYWRLASSNKHNGQMILSPGQGDLSLYIGQEKTGRPQLIRLHTGSRKMSDLTLEQRLEAGISLTKAGEIQLAAGLKPGEEDMLKSVAGRKKLEGLYFSKSQSGKTKK